MGISLPGIVQPCKSRGQNITHSMLNRQEQNWSSGRGSGGQYMHSVLMRGSISLGEAGILSHAR